MSATTVDVHCVSLIWTQHVRLRCTCVCDYHAALRCTADRTSSVLVGLVPQRIIFQRLVAICRGDE